MLTQEETQRLQELLREGGEMTFYTEQGELRVAVGLFLYGEHAEARAKELCQLVDKFRDRKAEEEEDAQK